MSLFAIGDLHLSLGEDKPMDVFAGWNDYVQRLEENWRRLVTDDDTVVSIPQSWRLKSKFLWERGVIWLANGLNKRNIFQIDIANAGTDITKMDGFIQADVIHLHWINQGFLSMADLERIFNSGKPVVITMHDQWHFTGVCHYSGKCGKYRTQCSHCPMLKRSVIDLARRIFDRKRAMYKDHNVTFVGCSRWMADLARMSPLTSGHTVVNVPNAIDTNVFTPADKMEARKRHNLPVDKQLLLFGAQRITDKRKGFRYLKEACGHLVHNRPEMSDKLGVVVLGGDAEKVKSALPLPVYTVDYMSNEAEIASLYNAVDLFVTPSLQDNLPNTIVEAMSCGTPCVGFDVGGIPEMINHQQDGYVARYRDSIDFAIIAIVNSPGAAGVSRMDAMRPWEQQPALRHSPPTAKAQSLTAIRRSINLPSQKTTNVRQRQPCCRNYRM